MDLATGPTRWLAGPVARFLDVDGRTPEKRRAEVIEHVNLPGDEVDDLGLRHLTRMAVWLVLCGALFVGGTIVLVPLSVFATERVKDLAFAISGWLTFFPFFMALVHLLKALVASYLPSGRWNPRSRLWRAALLAQTPDIGIALLMTAIVMLGWGG